MYYALDLNSEEKAALQKMAEDRELTPSQLLKLALRYLNYFEGQCDKGLRQIWVDENGKEEKRECGCAAND